LKTRIIALSIIALLAISFAMPLLASAKQDEAQLTIIELKANGKPDGKPGGHGNVIPPTDNSLSNPDYSLLRFRWYTTEEYWVNTANNYGFVPSQVVSVVSSSANAWDDETSATVFSYQGTTTRSAGTRDGYDVVDWGTYSSANVIAVTFIWSVRNRIVETDTRMNTNWAWSLSGEANKMDTQNILTHEFGHWIGLDDLYKNADYWLTMYGYADYGQTNKQTLGSGDINGLQAVCGP
jgi:hypothetical protein